MKTKDFISLAKQLLPVLPGFTIKGPMMFFHPVGHVLRGLCFEGSSFDAKSFYVWAFFLPLCVPTRHINFNLGIRIKNTQGERWNGDAPNLIADLVTALKHEALPFLSRVESLADLEKTVTSLAKPRDLYTQQAIVYASVYVGNTETSEELLTQFLRGLDTKIPWQREMAERAGTLKRDLATNPSAARQQLENWEDETVKNLGLS